MKSILVTLLFCYAFFIPPAEITMQGIKIGDPASVLKKLKLELTADDGDMKKYRTDEGNDLSVTIDEGVVVYLENDWLQNPGSRQPLFSGFKFGETSLRDIRNTFGTNGFTYQTRGSVTTETHLIAFNCFEFDSPNGEVLVTITKISLDANATKADVADRLKLDALIIASKDYLDKTWGAEKVFDSNYRKIKP